MGLPGMCKRLRPPLDSSPWAGREMRSSVPLCQGSRKRPWCPCCLNHSKITWNSFHIKFDYGCTTFYFNTEQCNPFPQLLLLVSAVFRLSSSIRVKGIHWFIYWVISQFKLAWYLYDFSVERRYFSFVHPPNDHELTSILIDICTGSCVRFWWQKMVPSWRNIFGSTIHHLFKNICWSLKLPTETNTMS